MDRLTDPIRCHEVTDKYPDDFTFPVEEWLANTKNVALIEEDNIAFGEFKRNGLYWVHFCYDSSRGRDAISLTKRMLQMFFSVAPVEIAIGPILLTNKKARWLIRQVGFKSLGEEETPIGRCEMFYFTREDLNGFL